MDGQPRIGLYDIGADELSAATIVRVPLAAGDVGPSWISDPPIDPPGGGGGCGPAGCAIQAEDFKAILDPDGDGNKWTTVDVAEALGGKVLKAPGGDRVELPTELHDTIATFELEFETPGVYTAYYRTRGFGGSSDSMFAPDDFGVDPDNSRSLSSNGQFSWVKDSLTFTITESHLGVPLEFRLGMREQDAELDTLVLNLNSTLSDSELDQLFAVVKGDYNDDGIVNFADYVVWRDSIGQIGNGLPADGDGSGTIDAGDYQTWKINMATVADSTLSTNATLAVPEPSQTMALFALLLTCGGSRSIKIGARMQRSRRAGHSPTVMIELEARR